MAIDKVERFTAVINQAADKKVKAFEEDAEQYIKREVEALEQELDEKLNSKLKFELDRIHANTNKEITELENASRKEISKKRKAIQAEVFAEVRKQVEAFVSGDGYRAFLAKSCSRLGEEIGADIVVYARKADLELVFSITADLPFVKAVKEAEDIELGGVYASDTDEAYFVYDTLDSRMDTCAENFLDIADLSVSGVNS